VREDHPLVESIYRVMTEGADLSKDQVEAFGKELSEIIANRINEKRDRPFTLRMSNLGKGARQLWYERKYGNIEKFEGKTLIKFLIGDITEHLLLFLAEVGGNDVTDRQMEVAVDGVKGHIDADINGVTVDAKSASSYAFRKFQDGTLADDDSFGYIEQLSGYCIARDTDGAFLAMDKVTGELCVYPISREQAGQIDLHGRIAYLKEAVHSENIPERCYPDEAEGASGNRKLGVNCSYCQFKDKCWADANGGVGLRKFLYSRGPVWLTHVAKEPKVYESVQFPTKD
jgi:hypothetical protein